MTSPAFIDWVSLVDNFYNKSNAIARAFDLKITFVLDGDAQPVACLRDKWRPWAATWINGTSPDEAFYSNDPLQGFDRFSVLNNEFNMNNWEWMATTAVHYGKFGDAGLSVYPPFQVWEPDHQGDIVNLAASYINSDPSAATYPALPGLDFAINMVRDTLTLTCFMIDLCSECEDKQCIILYLVPCFGIAQDYSMFRVFTSAYSEGRRSNKGWNEQLFANVSALLSTTEAPKVAYLGK